MMIKLLVHPSSLVLVIATLLAHLAPASLAAQGRQADYDRANRLSRQVHGTVTRDAVHPEWLSATRFVYRVDLAGGKREFVLVDGEAGTRKPAFDHQRMARELGRALGYTIDGDKLPIDRLRFTDEECRTALLLVDGRGWKCDLRRWAVESADADDLALPAFAPNGVPRSRNGGGDSAIQFINRREQPVQLWWVAADGERHQYGGLQPGESRRQHTFAGHSWLVTNAQGQPLMGFVAESMPGVAVITNDAPEPESRRGTDGDRPRNPQVSPDRRYRVFVRDHNLWVHDNQRNRSFALTTDGQAENYYEGRFHWSPDSRHVLAFRTVPGETHNVPLVESSPRDQEQPKLHWMNYLKPGDRITIRKPHLFRLNGDDGEHIAIRDDLFPNPWSINDVEWTPDSRRVLFVYNQRGHQVMRVIAVEAASGRATAVVNEECETYFDYASRYFFHYLPETDEIIWMSERDGWNHLFLIDGSNGRVKNTITRGDWVVRGVDRVDVEAREIHFRACGVNRDQDPYYIHHCRVGFDGRGFVDLTPGDGTHHIEYSPDGRYLVDRYSRVDMPTVTELRDARTGKLVCELEKGDASALLETGWKMPERFVARGRDGRTDIYGVIWRPSNFDETRRYPVIEQIYAGPHGQHVPKSFREWHGTPQYLAELGFVVVMMDGMGTAWRSREFSHLSHGNLGDGGFPDRVAWIKAAAQKYRNLDISRVGIYGGSAGGQNALRAMLAHGDFYKAAVADCGCHDNRMDKIWWNELYMGWPVGPHYAEQSNVTNAHRLTGKLMLVVGELDRNVDPASTMQVVDALVRANKDFDLLVMPGVGHGAAEHPYAFRRRADFFVRHLLGVEPRAR